MADLKYYDVIFKPLMTEKSMGLLEEQTYSFYVHPKATKVQIKEAVERLFNDVTVEKVNTMHTHPKKRQRRGSKAGETVRRKKAIVKLTPGSSPIEYFEGI
ncbi:MAG: 50S ribosomal protein L23 [Defluviitaleaceae bacterium]|nr:50S ribosomal protein L23 [Defluviitaleaceae bacterium]MCL2262684.1 50S ribosomal protein L23 [Defluviitaleaceae bacterium]